MRETNNQTKIPCIHIRSPPAFTSRPFPALALSTPHTQHTHTPPYVAGTPNNETTSVKSKAITLGNMATPPLPKPSHAPQHNIPCLYDMMMHLRHSLQQHIGHHSNTEKAAAKENEARILNANREKYLFAHEASKRILKISHLRHPHHHTYIWRYRHLQIFSGDMLFKKAKPGTGGTLSLRVLRTFSAENLTQQYMLEKGRSGPAVTQAINFSVDARLRIVETFLVLQAFACTAVGWWELCETTHQVQKLFDLFLSPQDWASPAFLESHPQLKDELRYPDIKKVWKMVEQVIECGTNKLIKEHGTGKRKVRLQVRPKEGEYESSLIQQKVVEVAVPSWTWEVVKHLFHLFTKSSKDVKALPGAPYVEVELLAASAVKCYLHFLENELGHVEDPEKGGKERDSLMARDLLHAILPDDFDDGLLNKSGKKKRKTNDNDENTKARNNSGDDVILIPDDDEEDASATTKKTDTRNKRKHSDPHDDPKVASHKTPNASSATAARSPPMDRVTTNISSLTDKDSVDERKEASPPHKKRKVTAASSDAKALSSAHGIAHASPDALTDAASHRSARPNADPYIVSASLRNASLRSRKGADPYVVSASLRNASLRSRNGVVTSAGDVAGETDSNKRGDTITSTGRDTCGKVPVLDTVGDDRGDICGADANVARKAGGFNDLDVSGDRHAQSRVGAAGDDNEKGEKDDDESFDGFYDVDAFDANRGYGTPPGFPPSSEWASKHPRSDVTKGLVISQLELITEVLLWDVYLSGNHRSWIQRFGHSYRDEAMTAHHRLYRATTATHHLNAPIKCNDASTANDVELHAQVVHDYTILWRYLYVYEVRSSLAEEISKLYPAFTSYDKCKKMFHQANEQNPKTPIAPLTMQVKKRLPSPAADLEAFSCIALNPIDGLQHRVLSAARGTFLCMCLFTDTNGTKCIIFGVSNAEGSDDHDTTWQKVTFSNKRLVEKRLILGENVTFKMIFVTSITQYLRTFAGVANVHLLPARLQQDIISPLETQGSSSTSADHQQIDPGSKAYIDGQLQERHINESQHKALKYVLGRIGTLSEKRSSFSLIQGPPGTGKTQSVVALIAALLSNSSNPAPEPDQEDGILRRGNLKRADVPTQATGISIAVLASSNVAVDLIIERIHKRGIPLNDDRVVHPQMIRIGKLNYKPRFPGGEQYMVEKKVERYWQDHSVPHEGEEAAAHLRPFHYGMLGVANETIICFSTVGACSSFAFTQLRKKFDVVIIDESSRTQDPELNAACIACHLSNLRSGDGIHCVLVGDHRQLGPLCKALRIFENHSAALSLKNDTEGHFESRLLSMSTFERLQTSDGSVPMNMLTIQYRMSPPISRIHSELFYDGLVTDGLDPSHFEKEYLVRKDPVTWIDTSLNHDAQNVFHDEIAGRGQYVNFYEAQVIQIILENLKAFLTIVQVADSSEWPCVSVVTPYKAQRNFFLDAQRPDGTSRCGKTIRLHYPKLRICTVDAMQGNEDDIVIISCVRAVREPRRRKGRANWKSRNSSPRQLLGFLADSNRLNVLFSRASYAIIVVGHASTLTGTDVTFWNRYYGYCQSRLYPGSTVERPFCDENAWSAREPWFQDRYKIKRYLSFKKGERNAQ